MTTSAEKVRENRLRRMAERQGFALRKSRRRDPHALDYGTYYLVDPDTGLLDQRWEWRWGMDVDSIEEILESGDAEAALATMASNREKAFLTAPGVIGEYMRERSNWRASKAEEYPEDPRNLQAADGLEKLADYVESLPLTDERIVSLAGCIMDGIFMPGPEASQAISRFRFNQGEVAGDCEAFVSRLAEDAPQEWFREYVANS
jgi:hypothetical protein